MGDIAEARIADCRAGHSEQSVVGDVVPFRPEIQMGRFHEVQRETANHGKVETVVAGAVEVIGRDTRRSSLI